MSGTLSFRDGRQWKLVNESAEMDLNYCLSNRVDSTEDRTGIPGAARIHSGVFSWDLMKRKTKGEIRNRMKLWASTDCSRRRIDVIADVVVGVGVGVAIQPLSVPAWVPTLLCLVPH
ncbi:uncharacterized protein RAG0_03964 [Rhynchosporium agropyri]|uniref:Uncharacterized protein n=1 Tax=Rhynchosporium agropyri TaxID=914238 RepID=A0A1E1K7M1_9HELO|nr:uncharacterized protein RAG0_03964 [Rhynchosporium agropyri]